MTKVAKIPNSKQYSTGRMLQLHEWAVQLGTSSPVPHIEVILFFMNQLGAEILLGVEICHVVLASVFVDFNLLCFFFQKLFF